MPGRCFLAIDLPAAWKGELAAVRTAYLDEADAWAGEKWVPRELLHVTLRFIGALDDAAVPAALRSIEEACAHADVPRLALSAVRAVPSPRRAAMLWATIADEDAACTHLARTIDAALEVAVGLRPDSRAFRPHVTLVRARRPRSAPLPALDAAGTCLVSGPPSDRETSVRSFTLYSSTLGRSGPDYRALGHVRVGG